MAEQGILVDVYSLAAIRNIVAFDAEDGNVVAAANSLLKVVDGNQIGDSDDDTGLLVTGNATAFIGGSNTLSAEYGALDCEFAGVIMQEGEGPNEMMTVNGRTSAVENCFIFIGNADLNGNIEMQQNSSMTLEAEEDGSSVTVTGDVRMSQQSSLVVDDEGTVNIGGGLVFLLNSSITMRSGTLTSSLQLHASSRAEFLTDVVTPTGTNVIELHSFSTLQSSQSNPVTETEVICFGDNAAFFNDGVVPINDLCD